MITIENFNRTHCVHPKFSRNFKSDNTLRSKLKNIEKQRISDPNEELLRLISNPSIQKRLNNLMFDYERDREFYYDPSPLHQVSFCRSIEVLNAIRDTHFVLNHGESNSSMLGLNILNTELYRLQSPEELLDFEVRLRHSSTFLKWPKDSQIDSVDWFKSVLNHQTSNKNSSNLTDNNFSNYLIACDGYLQSTANAESAWSFFLDSGSNDTIKWKIINHLAEHLILDFRKRNSFLLKFKEIDEEICDSNHRFGNLYSILVPKNEFDSIGYLSMSLGFAIESAMPSQALLEELQNDETSEGQYYGSKRHLQVRLLAEKVSSLNLTTLIFPARLDHEFKRNIEEIRSLVKDFFLKENRA